MSPWSKYIAWWASRRGLTPNHVTALSVAVAVLAAACCAIGTRPGYVAGAVLVMLAFGLDCADGQLARLTGLFSALGGWLDGMCDRLKEYVVYAGLAVGAARTGADVWLLAVAALVLQTVRHALDSAWAVTPASAGAQAEGVRRRATGGRRRGHWLRKVAVLPLGERSLLTSMLIALTAPRIVFVVLLVGGGLAGAYMLAAQVSRSLRPAAATPDPEAGAALLRMCDFGPLLAALVRGRSLAPRWGWLLPPALRAGEYAVIAVAGLVCGAGVGPVTYAYLLLLIWHHYDAAYRLRHRVAASPVARLAGLGGVEVRTAAVAVLAAVGAPAYLGGLAIAAVVLAITAVAGGLELARRDEPLAEGPPERSEEP